MKSVFDKKAITRKLPLSLGIVVAFCVAIFIFSQDHIPSWVKWQEKSICLEQADFENWQVSVKNRKLTVFDKDHKNVFESEKALKVQDAITTDVDGDGLPEIIAVVWKKGLYGKHKPFWVTSDEKSYSQHVFIYGIDEDGKVSQKWFASETGILIRRMKLMDQKPEIVLFEDIDGDCTLWRWKDFGLKNIDNEVRFVAFGDNIIHSAIMDYANEEQGGNYEFLYEPFQKEIKEADIAAFNAETVLVEKDNMISGYPSFGSPVAVGEAVAKAGFDVAVCANNHVLDKGLDGLEFTKEFYEVKGIKCPGIQDRTETEYRPYELISRNGITFALFSYTYGTNAGDISEKYPNVVHYLPGDEEQEKELLADMQRAREEADIVVVFVHWGEEYELQPNSNQRAMAVLFINGGADVVIGSHPHVLQEMDEVRRPDGGTTIIYYSLGNFRADQGKDESTKTGGEAVFTAWHTYDGVKIKSHELKEIRSYWRD